MVRGRRRYGRSRRDQPGAPSAARIISSDHNRAGPVASPTVIVSIAGIVVSGVVGPAVSTWAARVSARRQFVRDREATRRDELLSLLDEAASILGLGPVRLRQTREHASDRTTPEAEVRIWPEQVYALGQRLRLRLGAEHEVVTAYERVRARLVECGQIGSDVADTQKHENAILRFEAARGEFLDAAGRALKARISDKDPTA